MSKKSHIVVWVGSISLPLSEAGSVSLPLGEVIQRLQDLEKEYGSERKVVVEETDTDGNTIGYKPFYSFGFSEEKA